MTCRPSLFGIGILICAHSVAAQQTSAQATYTLKATPKTVAWGYYDAKAVPVLRVKSGDTVEIRTQLASTAARDEKHPIIYVKHLEPPLRYPALARQTRLSGTIVMKLRIGADGAVLAIESSPGDSRTTGFTIFRADAEKIVKTWTFGCVGCPPDDPFEHTLKFHYTLDDQDVVQDNRVIMNLPDELTIYTSALVIDHGPDTKISKKRSQ